MKPTDERPEGVSLLDVKGNAFTDTYARCAADRVCIPLEVASPQLYWVHLATKVQRRLATIIMNLPDRMRNSDDITRPPKVQKQPISELAAASQHKLSWVIGWFVPSASMDIVRKIHL